MIAPNPHSNCMDARVYYYDFLREETRKGIPQGAFEHMAQCGDCQVEMDRLKAVLERLDNKIDNAQSLKNTAIGTLLKLHFAYIGEPVTCETVKPFLPPLADPALQIRTPTPITAHIDRCRACSDDLATLRGLRLTHKQLCHLGQLLADKATGDDISCSQAQDAIPSVVSMVLSETNAETLKHLCVCTECRRQLARHRETLRNRLLEGGPSQNDLPCEDISAVDIFDYCLPYGLDPADDQYAGFRESLTSHLRSCPTCMARIQELHNTICGIAGRPASDIATIYNITEQPAEQKSLGESDGPYAGFPVEVKLVQPAHTIDFAARLKRKTAALTAKPLLRTGAVAAAVLLIGLGLLLSGPTATAVTFDQVSRAVKGIRNVHITRLSDKGEIMQEFWVSRPMNIYTIKSGEDLVLYDIMHKVRKAKLVGSDSVEQIMLPDDDCAALKNRIDSSFGLLPFERMSNVPKGTTWSRVSDEALRTAEENIEVYDLTYLAPSSPGSEVLAKARFFVDSKTGFPTKAERYRKHSADSEYVLQSQFIVEHMSDAQFQALVKDSSF